jgi:uncharacterized protein YndB with AHSA1/START domain
MTTDRIEKKILLRASRARVWRALTDAAEFGSWFGMKLDGPFVAGAMLGGIIVPTQADRSVAAQQKAFEGKPVSLQIEQIEPERLFSFRWHPFAVDPGVDYASEPTTLVAFELAEAPGGTLLTVTESGFDRIPLARRAQAFSSNEQGWAIQVTLIEKHLARSS